MDKTSYLSYVKLHILIQNSPKWKNFYLVKTAVFSN